MRNLDLLNEVAYKVGKFQDSYLGQMNQGLTWWVALLASKLGDIAGHSHMGNRKEAREDLLSLAAVCIAEIEELDRLEGLRRETERQYFNPMYIAPLDLDYPPLESKDDDDIQS